MQFILLYTLPDKNEFSIDSKINFFCFESSTSKYNLVRSDLINSDEDSKFNISLEIGEFDGSNDCKVEIASSILSNNKIYDLNTTASLEITEFPDYFKFGSTRSIQNSDHFQKYFKDNSLNRIVEKVTRKSYLKRGTDLNEINFSGKDFNEFLTEIGQIQNGDIFIFNSSLIIPKVNLLFVVEKEIAISDDAIEDLM